MSDESDWDVVNNGVTFSITPLSERAWEIIDEEIGRYRLRYGQLTVSCLPHCNDADVNRLAESLGLFQNGDDKASR